MSLFKTDGRMNRPQAMLTKGLSPSSKTLIKMTVAAIRLWYCPSLKRYLFLHRRAALITIPPFRPPLHHPFHHHLTPPSAVGMVTISPSKPAWGLGRRVILFQTHLMHLLPQLVGIRTKGCTIGLGPGPNCSIRYCLLTRTTGIDMSWTSVVNLNDN